MEVGFEAAWSTKESERLFEGKKLRVLLVEDCPDTRLLVSTLLDGLGVECSTAFSSEAALEMVSVAQKDGWPCDLLLVDICLPGMDGITMVRVLRGRGYTGRIVVASARVSLEDREECQSAGCDTYINKLSGYADFLKELRRCLRECQNSGEIRTSEAASVKGSDPEYVAIVDEFVHNLGSVLAQLGTAAGNHDWQVIDCLCHKLKTAMLFGYPALSEAAQALGESARMRQEGAVWNDLRRLEKQIRLITCAEMPAETSSRANLM